MLKKAIGYMGKTNGDRVLTYQLCDAAMEMARDNWGPLHDLPGNGFGFCYTRKCCEHAKHCVIIICVEMMMTYYYYYYYFLR